MNQRSQNLSRLQIALIASVTVSFVLLMLLAIGVSMGSVSGVEFSPDDFSRRSFSYTRLPIVKWTLVKKRYQEYELKLDLVGDGWISARPVTTWHLVSENQVDRQPTESDARFLVDLLDLRCPEDFSNIWIQWNEKYPDFAKLFWPIIAQLARDELYLAIPEFVELALQLDRLQDQLDDTEMISDFERQLNTKLQAAYQLYGTIDQNSGRTERANYRLEKANQFK